MSDVHELTGVYALDALPPEEEAAFEAHLEACASCRAEVEEFREVCADLGRLVERSPPSSLRTAVLGAIEGTDAVATVQWATRELLAARTRDDVVDTVLAVVERLGGWTVAADRAGDDALPLDVGLGRGSPLLPVAPPGSRARQDLEQYLPQVVEDARQALETVHRTSPDGSSARRARESRGDER